MRASPVSSGQPLEKVVAVRRTLAQQEQQRRLGEPLHAGENAPAAAVMTTCARASHPTLPAGLHVKNTCKRHYRSWRILRKPG